MRYLRTLVVIFLSVSVLGLNACIRNHLTDLNVNPNEQTTADAGLLFKYSLREGVGSYNSDVNVEQWGLMNWVMFTASRNGVTPGEEYVIPGGKDQLWNEQYVNALVNVQEALYVMGDSAQYTNQRAACMIWKVFLFHRLTDLWGSIPYSEALQGYSDLNLMPAYDSQAAVYYDLINQLKTASEIIDPSQGFFSEEIDLIYSGDVTLWQVFANSLRLRIATRLRYIDPERYTQELTELKDARLMAANNESVLFPFNSEKKNHLYEAYYSGQAIVQNNPSLFLTNMLNDTNDPRISILLEPAPISEIFPWYDAYKGIPNLLPANSSEWDNYESDWSDVSGIGNWFLRNETPGVLLSYAEVCFLKAEAAEFGIFDNMQTHYETGIAANMRFYGDYGEAEHSISEAEIENYLMSAQPADLESIITQKWLVFVFENGYEAYAEFRRTGYPAFTDYFGNPIDSTMFPKRLPYPNSETTLNAENYNAAVQAQGPDNVYTPIWWDTF